MNNANGKKINSFIQHGRYDAAIILARSAIKKLPSNDWDAHWLYTQLSSAYYEKHKYSTALKYSSKAMAIAPNCPLSLWHYAGDLVCNNKSDMAISIYHKILKKRFGKMCNESKEQTIALKSDCRIRLAMCYYSINQLQKARHWVKLFIRNFPLDRPDRNGGVEGIDKKKFGEKLLAKYEKEIRDETNR
jgi:tetratricopeptide (TPR) repeat protein